MVIETLGQPFGCAGAQYNYVRDPHAVVHFARTMLKILASHYTDDVWGIEVEATAKQAHGLILELNNLIGWVIDYDKSPTPQGTFRLLGPT